MKRTKLAAILCAAVTAAALTGCGKEESADIGNTTGTGATVINRASGAETGEMVTETRPLEEGDDYAINKINPRSPEGSVPGGYTLQSYTEEQQGKLFANGKSKVVIRAYNYKEDLQELAVWAEQACAVTKIANITSACDTSYSEPEDTTLMGFDAVKYYYDIVQYEFLEGSSGEEIKNPIGRYKGISYYFYSDQDAYVISFDSAEEDFEEQSAAFLQFLDDLEITETEY